MAQRACSFYKTYENNHHHLLLIRANWILIFEMQIVFMLLKIFILQFTRTSSNLFCHNPKGIKLVARLFTKVRHLSKHKSSTTASNLPVWYRCRTMFKFLSSLSLIFIKRCTLQSSVENDDNNWLSSGDLRFTQLLFFGGTFHGTR